jgi:hypothetical protein
MDKVLEHRVGKNEHCDPAVQRQQAVSFFLASAVCGRARRAKPWPPCAMRSAETEGKAKQMTDGKRVKQMTNGVATMDGGVVKFDVITMEDETIALQIPASDIGRVVAFLVGLAEHAAKNKPAAERPQSPPMQWEGSPIPVETIGVAPGKTAQETVLVFNLGDTSIGFALPAGAYSALLELARLAQVGQFESRSIETLH